MCIFTSGKNNRLFIFVRKQVFLVHHPRFTAKKAHRPGAAGSQPGSSILFSVWTQTSNLPWMSMPQTCLVSIAIAFAFLDLGRQGFFFMGAEESLGNC